MEEKWVEEAAPCEGDWEPPPPPRRLPLPQKRQRTRGRKAKPMVRLPSLWRPGRNDRPPCLRTRLGPTAGTGFLLPRPPQS